MSLIIPHHYEIAKQKVFYQSNWKTWTVNHVYIDRALEQEIGNKGFVEDWLDEGLF
jgi:hypothetical protein